MENELKGVRVAILATDGFEQSELLEPQAALIKAGADVSVVSPKGSRIKAWDQGDWGQFVKVDKLLEETGPEEFDCLLIPGGVINPDKLRKEAAAVDFVRDFIESGRPIAAICHGPQLLIETNLLEGRRLTSYSSIKTDLINAGANWVDEAVVNDHGLVTSRRPSDLPVFIPKMIEEFGGSPREPRVSEDLSAPL